MIFALVILAIVAWVGFFVALIGRALKVGYVNERWRARSYRAEQPRWFWSMIIIWGFCAAVPLLAYLWSMGRP